MVIAPDKRRWILLGVMFFAIIFNYVDRQIVSILKPTLKAAYGMADSDYAFIVNTFTICYAIMYPVAGWLVDRFGIGKTMFYGVLAWSVACIGGGLSKTLGQFTFFRGMLGLTEPTNFPSQLKLMAVWFPAKLRATAHTICVSSSSIGAVIAPPLVAWISIHYGWKNVFVICGGVGIFIALLWKALYRHPPANSTAMESELPVTGEAAFKWSELWKTKTLYALVLIRMLIDPVWYFCLFWLPGYLQEESKLTLAQVGMYGWIPFLAADLGGLATALWSDGFVKKGWMPLDARKRILFFATLAAPLCAVVPFSPGIVTTFIVFSIVAALCLTWLHTLSLVIAEAFPVKNVASVLGIAGGFGAMGAVVFNYFVGQVMGTVGAQKIFFCMALLHPVAALILWKVVKREQPTREPVMIYNN